MQRRDLTLLLLISCALLSQSPAAASNLVNRYRYLNPETLPDGVWTFAVSEGRSTGATDRSFSDGGDSISNQAFFSRNVTYSNLLDETPNPLERELAGAAFRTYGRDLSDSAGTVVNDVNVSQSSRTFVVGRGFGDRNSLFVVLPIVTLKTQFQSRYVPSASLRSLTDELRGEGLPRQAEVILERSKNALRNRLEENSYRTDYPSELTTLANVFINHRYSAFRSKKAALSVDSTLVVPAGKTFDENDFLQLRVNEEQLSYRQSVTGRFMVDRRFSLLSSAHYHKRFAFNRAIRVPYNSTSPISADIDPSARIQYGDTSGLSAQTDFRPIESLAVYLGQSYEGKLRNRMAGTLYSEERYRFLEQNSEQSLGLTYFGVSWNSVSAFLSNTFPAPIDLNLQYSFPTSGRNTFEQNVVSMNLMVFYK